MSAHGKTRGARVASALRHWVVWPVLDARDWMLRRDVSKPWNEAHHPTLFRRSAWAVLDRKDDAARAIKHSTHLITFRMRRLSPELGRTTAMLALAVPLLLVSGLVLAAFTSQDVKATRAADRAAPPRIEVAGVADSSQAREERRAERRRAARRRAERRERAADRKRAARRRRAAARRERRAARAQEEEAAAAATPPAEPTPPAPETPSTTPTSPSPSAPSGGGTPSNGGGGSSGGGGGGGGSTAPTSPQPEPGVEFEDEG